MKKLLFVCTGNTCRSCMAEAIAKELLKEQNMAQEIYVSSAGIHAVPEDKASLAAVKVMDEYGVDIKAHCARLLNPDLVKQSDIILSMTESHKRVIIDSNPDAKSKVFTLKEYAAGTSGDIKDPYGGSAAIYKDCVEELKIYITKALYKI